MINISLTLDLKTESGFLNPYLGNRLQLRSHDRDQFNATLVDKRYFSVLVHFMADSIENNTDR